MGRTLKFHRRSPWFIRAGKSRSWARRKAGLAVSKVDSLMSVPWHPVPGMDHFSRLALTKKWRRARRRAWNRYFSKSRRLSLKRTARAWFGRGSSPTQLI